MRVAIPRMGEYVAPCFEYSAMMAIFIIEGAKIVEQLDFPIRSRDPLDRVRLLRDQHVDTIICGGVQETYEDVLRASGFRTISWVSGPVEDLLDRFLQNKLVAGSRLGAAPGPTATTHSRPGR